MNHLPDPRTTFYFVIDTLDPLIDELIGADEPNQQSLLIALAVLREHLAQRMKPSEN